MSTAVSYFAKIDPSQFWRQGWKYALRLHVPSSAWPEVKRILGTSFDRNLDPSLAVDVTNGMTVLIPYLQETDTILPAATQITYLLEGDKHIESRGRVRQEQTISGTSGFLAAMPHPGNKLQQLRGDIQRGLQPFIGTNGLTLSPKGERAGYGWFHRFIYLAEAFWAIRRLASAKVAGEVKFVWFNERDDQIWSIEPMNLRWRRSVPKNKFTVNWSLTFEVVEDFSKNAKMVEVAPLTEKVHNPLEEIANAKRAMQQAREGFLALLTRGVDYVTGVVTDIIGVIDEGLAIIDSVGNTAAILVRSVSNIVNQTLSLGARLFITLDNLALGPDSPLYQAANELYVSAQQGVDRLAQAFNRLTAPRPWQIDEKERQRAQGGAPRGNTPGSSVWNEQNAQSSLPSGPVVVDPNDLGSTIYGSGLPPTDNRHSALPATDPFQPIANSSRIASIYPGDTIFDVAKRELGDGRAWASLVHLNDLSSPYIVSRGADTQGLGRVLRYEDPILIPVQRSDSLSYLDYYRALTSPIQGRTPQFTGFAEAATSSVIRIRDANRTTPETKWVPGGLRGYTLSILEGTGKFSQHTVRDNDADSFTTALVGATQLLALGGATSITLQTGQGTKFPTQGPLFFNYGTGGQVNVTLTSRVDDTLTFTPALVAPLAMGTPVHQIDEVFNFLPDGSTQYLLWYAEITRTDPPNATPDMAFGLDLKLVRHSSGLLDMIQGPDGDAAVVTGIEAYAQSLRIVLDHGIGGNFFNPEDGVPLMIGQKATLTRITTYLMYARRALLSDPRTADILSEFINVGGGGDILSVEFRVLTVEGLEVTVDVSRPSLDFPSV